MKVKIFDGHNTSILENGINKWIEENPTIKIKKIKQSTGQLHDAMPITTISIFYRNKHSWENDVQ